MEAQHALQVPVVVQNLFTLMSPSIYFEDFKSARGVCRVWYHESLSFWRKKAVITFHSKPLFSPSSSSGGVHPADFLTELNNSQDFYALDSKPFQNCKFVDLELHMDHLKNNANAAQFWSLVGPNIRDLTLEKVKFNSETLLSLQEMLLDFLLTKTQNLEHLTLTQISGNNEDPRYAFNFTLLSVQVYVRGLKSLTLDSSLKLKLANFPHLQQLKLLGNVSLLDMFSYGAGFINTSIRRLDLLDNIHVSYNNTFNDSVRFTELQHLAMSIGYADNRFDGLFDRVEQLSTFIEKCMFTLQSIHMLQWSLYEEIVTSPFKTRMNSLTELKLWGQIVPDLSFLQNMPNIQILHVDVLGVEKAEQVKSLLVSGAGIDEIAMLQYLERDLVKASVEKGDMIGVRLPHLTELFLSCVLSVESVRALAEWMPNLKILKAILNFTTLPVVTEQWKEVETLYCLFGSDLSDGDLQGLKKFKRLHKFRYYSECDVRDLTCAQVFLVCAELTHLEICVSEKFTADEESQIKSKIPNFKCHRNYGENKEHTEWKCCKFKEYRNFIVSAHAGSEYESQDGSLSDVESSVESDYISE